MVGEKRTAQGPLPALAVSIFLAAVLFLVGIGSSFKLHSLRCALIAFGSVVLTLAVVLILRQPGLPG